MEDKDDELIERYYLNDLNEAELAEFQRRLKEDESFWEAVHLHADALEAIRLEAIALLRKRLAAKGRELDAGRRQPAGRPWWIAGPIAVLLGALIWWWATHKEPPASTPTPETDNNAVPPVADTIPAISPPEEQRVPTQKTPDHQQIFAAWFQPYKEASLEPARRGDGDLSPSERFQQLYWDSNYRAALFAFDSLGAAAQNNDNLLFLKANCLLDAGNADGAARILVAIVRNGRSRFPAQATWYLALAQLRGGKRREAIALLRRIAADPVSPRQADARGVLRELE